MFRRCLFIFLLTIRLGYAHELLIDDHQSIKDVSQKIAYKMMQFYPGNQTGGIPGLFGDPYYWWEAGAAFGALIDYWWYTNDSGYNACAIEAMLHQVGPEENYMPPNQSKSLGNDDQGFWGLTVMAAAEKNFPNPPDDQPQWLSLAQAVFNTQAARWDEATCRGGLRWQIYTFNKGFDYKNTVSNGVFFMLAARLARYTGNETYADWAVKTWDWTQKSGLMTENYKFYDGFRVGDQCTNIDIIQWTYNAGLYLAGAAFLYNFTDGNELWKTRVNGIMQMTRVFFPNDIMAEMACEPYMTCNVDQRSFKAYMARFMALTIKMAPFTADFIMPKLRTSAIAAARYCSFGEDGNTCGMRWKESEWDKWWGVGEQMSALETIQSNMILGSKDFATAKRGGTSEGNPAAGNKKAEEAKENTRALLQRDRAGAKALTALLVIGILGFAAWISL